MIINTSIEKSDFFALDLSATKFETSNLQNLAVQSAKTCYYSIRVTANTYYLIEISAENLLFAKGIFCSKLVDN